MNKLSIDIMEKLRSIKPQIAGPMKLKRLRVYGSVARGEAAPSSDVDLLIEFTENPDLIDFVGFRHQFEDFLQRKVDLTTPECLYPEIRSIVLVEAQDV